MALQHKASIGYCNYLWFMTYETYLLLGTNLGNKLNNLNNAREQINKSIGKINKLSRIYETAAWGNHDQPAFYNQVIQINTRLSPFDLLNELHRIELNLGRVRHEKWGERIIDIDILYYAEQVIESEQLTIPHPQIQHRKFTLLPLSEVAPDLVHPVLGKTNLVLLEDCLDDLSVIPI